MSDIKVNNKLFNIPDPGASPNWAKDVTNWIKEVSAVLASIAGLGSITETQSIIENGINVLTPKLVAGLLFNSNLTKSSEIAYRIYRKTQNTTAVAESGIMRVHYSDIDPLNKWSIQREIVNGEPTFVYFDIDNTGQIKYHSSLINNNTPTPDSNYEGFIRFKTTNIIK